MYITSICTLSIIIHKFCYRQELCVIVLFSIDKGTKISFYYAILFLSLAIYLRIKYSKKLLLNTKKVE